MMETRVEKLADMILENEKKHYADKDIIVYGLLNAIEQVAGIVTTIILGSFFGLLLESIVFLVSFSAIRMYAGGYHCKTAIQCYFMSVGTIFAVLMIVKYTPQEYIIPICILLLLISAPLIWKLAPVGATNKPLDEVEKQHYRKITIRNLVIECCVISGLLITGFSHFAFVMSLGMMVTAGVVVLQKNQNKN